MSIWDQQATSGGGKTEACPAGSHPAILVGILDLGTHRETFTNKETGEERTSDLRKVYLIWELTDEPMSGYKDRNHVLARDYNVSFGPAAALRKMVEGVRGKAFAEGEKFSIKDMLGKPFLVDVVHGTSAKGNVYAKINKVGGVPRKISVSPPRIDPFAWSFGDGEPCPDTSWMPYIYGEKVADYLARSKEAKAGGLALASAENDEDGGEIPF